MIKGVAPSYFASGIAHDIPVQFQLLGEWIGEKFGSSIIAESCRICQEQGQGGNGTQPPPPVNGSGNGTVIPTFSGTNYTMPTNCSPGID